jgi:hypothetical protein
MKNVEGTAVVVSECLAGTRGANIFLGWDDLARVFLAPTLLMLKTLGKSW